MNNFDKALQEQVVIFLHLPKTAGTTLRYIIQYQCQPKALIELYDDAGSFSQRVDKLKNLSDSRRKEIKIVTGHLGFGLHEFLLRPCTYITFLRDPVDRVVSLYYYYQRTENQKFKDLSLEEFIQTAKHAKNNMTTILAGEKFKLHLTDPVSARNYQCSQESLEIAKNNLKNNFKVIGFLDRFDEGLMLLKRILGWEIPLYDKHNVSKKRPSTSELPKETLSLIKKANEYDIQLYQYARELYANMINQQGSDFEREVEEFKKANEASPNKLYFKLHTFYNRLVHRTYKELINK